MKKITAFLFIFFSSTLCFATRNYYVSGSGMDSNSGLSASLPLQTLKGVYDKMHAYYTGGVVTEPVNIYAVGNIYLDVSGGLNKLTWDITGTSSNTIVFTTLGSDQATICRTVTDNSKDGYMIVFKSVKYIKVSKFKFLEATVGVYLNSSSFCTIERCEFYSNQLNGGGGAGMLCLTSDNDNLDFAHDNIVQYNKFVEDGENTNLNIPTARLYHGIYLGQANNNQIIYNYIVNASGSGITAGGHGYVAVNTISCNTVDMKKGTDPSCFIWRFGFTLDRDGNSNTPDYLNYGNILTKNYVSFSEQVANDSNRYYSPIHTQDVDIDNDILAYNPNNQPNYCSHADLDVNQYVEDPFWVYYNASMVKDRMVTGDFDGDGNKDDIAAIYDYGNATAQIHIWLQKRFLTSFRSHLYIEQDKSFSYQGSWWVSSNHNEYDANKITGRVVSGDFNGDHKDDIAALYDYGAGNSVLQVWLSNGTGFASPVSWWTSSTGGYDATKVTGRFVSGYFDGDNKCDIAAMYDYGGGTSAIHTWLSTGSSFSPTGYANTWWSSSAGSYNATKVTYRFVSGNFDGTGCDDIAAMYDYGGGTSAIHTWISNGSQFTPTGYAFTWWSSATGGYDANKVTERFVSGDFDKNGKTDIAAMYDYGSNNARLHTFLSDGSTFTPSGYANTWWTSNTNSYDPSKVTGRILCGDFNNDGMADVAGMFDYSFTNFYRTRFHVWESSGSVFNMQNDALGYPWMDYAGNIGIRHSNPEETNALNTNSESAFSVSPNPFKEKTILQIPESTDLSKTQIFVFNMLGEKVMSYKPDNYSFEISREGLVAGIYIITVSVDGNNCYSKKIIVTD